MTIKINTEDEERVHLCVDDDIYQEHAECLRDMIFSQARRGIKSMDIKLCRAYYINSEGQKYLQEMKIILKNQGVIVLLQTN
ncbi:MAG: hypothetical protein LLG02_16045 [Pelosinus sp.]|nr:hypothetical protein [Pelosinus sp.]